MNIFQENDYKEILKFLIKTRFKSSKGIYSKIADHLGVNPSMVSQIFSGSKDFSEVQIVSLSEFLSLNKLERRYLLTLIQIARAGSVALAELQKDLLEEIRVQAQNLTNRIQAPKALSDMEQVKFYSTWLYSAVQLSTTLEKHPSFADICARFHLQPSSAQQILNFLIEIGLVTESGGFYKSGPCQTHLDKNSPLIVNHHKNWRIKAIQSADLITPAELMYSCNFSVSKKDFSIIKEEFMQILQKFLKIAESSPAEDIAQLNLDLFWIRN